MRGIYQAFGLKILQFWPILNVKNLSHLEKRQLLVMFRLKILQFWPILNVKNLSHLEKRQIYDFFALSTLLRGDRRKLS